METNISVRRDNSVEWYIYLSSPPNQQTLKWFFEDLNRGWLNYRSLFKRFNASKKSCVITVPKKVEWLSAFLKPRRSLGLRRSVNGFVEKTDRLSGNFISLTKWNTRIPYICIKIIMILDFSIRKAVISTR